MREIRVDHVSKSFGKAKALDDVSLSFEHGKIHALLGRNGAGKSTLLGLIANRLVPTSGRIFVDDEPAADNARALAKLYCMNDKKMYPENLRVDVLFDEMGRFYESFDAEAAAGMPSVRPGRAQEDRRAVHGLPLRLPAGRRAVAGRGLPCCSTSRYWLGRQSCELFYSCCWTIPGEAAPR